MTAQVPSACRQATPLILVVLALVRILIVRARFVGILLAGPVALAGLVALGRGRVSGAVQQSERQGGG